MKKRLCLLAGVSALAITGLAAQEDSEITYGTPRYTVLPPKFTANPGPAQATTTPLTTFNGSFTFHGTTYTYNMVGKAPSANTPVTIKAFIIPVKIVITSKAGVHTALDPSHVLANGNTVTANTVASPLFDATTNYVQGAISVGTTQYIDAYARANFWHAVTTHPNYHLLLSAPTVLAEQTLSPPSNKGTTGSPFGQKVGLVDIDWFDGQLHSLIAKFPQITPNSIPIFLTYNVYLTQSGGCCIGGYHSSEGSIQAAQSYMHATYDDRPGVFSQDVSALSHELGEWYADPLVNNFGNNTPCGILENGDPLEGDPNFGGFPYTVNGFSYNLQDLVTLPYFGAPANTSVNNWSTFQGQTLAVCQNGS